MNLERKPYILAGTASPPLIYVGISRGSAYSDVDLTTVTSAVATVYLPGATASKSWTMTPVAALTTADRVVLSYQPVAEDVAKAGKITLLVTPYVDETALVSSEPFTIAVRPWAPV